MNKDIEELKRRVGELEKKYHIPSFKVLNENFEIEKIEVVGDCLIRLIRKVMMEKIVNSLNFIDMLLNPVNAPRIYYSYLKSVNADDKEIMEELYSKLGILSFKSLALEVEYDELAESALINETCSVWNSLKPKFKKIISNIETPRKEEAKKEKSYFG